MVAECHQQVSDKAPACPHCGPSGANSSPHQFGPMQFEIVEEHEGISDILAAIRRGIRGADPSDVRERDYQPLYLTLRGADGEIQGGLYGATMWDWLMIDGLWVAEALRGRGFGSQLLEA